jgi:electron transfer flavoprotein alpha subunit
VRFIAVIDGTAAGATPEAAAGVSGGAHRQAAAMGAFLRGGLTSGAGAVRGAANGQLSGETLVFYHDERQKDRLVELAPTRDVRLVRTGTQRFERKAALLSTRAEGDQTDLFLFAGGPAGTELATRLACRSGGAVLTDVLSAEAAADRLMCRRYIYSGHLVGSFALLAPPWCVGIDPSWADADAPDAVEHVIVSDIDETGGDGPEPFEERESLEAQSTDDLSGTRFLVVAGRGAGSHRGVDRIAQAARLLGADFGVTRPVAMNAWAPMDRLIGVSGARAAPALCIVAGASGAPAFYWGIEKAGLIVAIDLDEHAAVVRDADLVLLDDAVSVLEELAAIVAAERQGR